MRWMVFTCSMVREEVFNINQPTNQPTNHHLSQPSDNAKTQPSIQPSNHPTTQPPNHPTTQQPNNPTTQPPSHSPEDAMIVPGAARDRFLQFCAQHTVGVWMDAKCDPDSLAVVCARAQRAHA